jgi:hypothetical protein
MVKRIKRGMAARQLFITKKDFDESLKDAIKDSENLAASGSNFAVVRRDFVFKNLELNAKTKKTSRRKGDKENDYCPPAPPATHRRTDYKSVQVRPKED